MEHLNSPLNSDEWNLPFLDPLQKFGELPIPLSNPEKIDLPSNLPNLDAIPENVNEPNDESPPLNLPTLDELLSPHAVPENKNFINPNTHFNNTPTHTFPIPGDNSSATPNDNLPVHIPSPNISDDSYTDFLKAVSDPKGNFNTRIHKYTNNLLSTDSKITVLPTSIDLDETNSYIYLFIYL
ncbi:unnamed protein product [Euphydryas editha]|uniref:Uncharacterized protein n=1 Tax=Euphydryas editha TaxID=104508 RepID=A0AAU9TN50_EUPED|nr:unnamed protein product [Euphydryas editha]